MRVANGPGPFLGPAANGAALEAIMRRRPGEAITYRVGGEPTSTGVPVAMFTLPPVTGGEPVLLVAFKCPNDSHVSVSVQSLTLIEIGPPGDSVPVYLTGLA